VSPVRYVVGFYIREDGILHSHRRENLKSYMNLKFRCFSPNSIEFQQNSCHCIPADKSLIGAAAIIPYPT
jgi:hypothetical protein